MPYHHRRGNLLGAMLKAIGECSGAFSWPLEFTEEWRHEQVSKAFKSSKRHYNYVWYLKKQGLVRVAEKQGRKFLKLTAKGELRRLLEKTSVTKPGRWDGKWRLVIFDIPESAKEHRHHLRRLLYEAGFKKLQASVFISPYALNPDGIEYLKASGLMEFIRILRVDKVDNDNDLKKKFGVA